MREENAVNVPDLIGRGERFLSERKQGNGPFGTAAVWILLHDQTNSVVIAYKIDKKAAPKCVCFDLDGKPIEVRDAGFADE